MSTQKTSYTDEELQEFRDLILHKLDQAIRDYDLLRESATDRASNDVSDTQPTFKAVHEGAAALSKGEAGRMAERLLKFIHNLQAALRRIENKTYGKLSSRRRSKPTASEEASPQTDDKKH